MDMHESKYVNYSCQLTCHDKCPYVSLSIEVDSYSDPFEDQAWKKDLKYELYSLWYEKSRRYDAKDLAAIADEDCYYDLN